MSGVLGVSYQKVSAWLVGLEGEDYSWNRVFNSTPRVWQLVLSLVLPRVGRVSASY